MNDDDFGNLAPDPFTLGAVDEQNTSHATVTTTTMDTDNTGANGQDSGNVAEAAMIEVASPHFDDFHFSPYPGLHDDGNGIAALQDDSTNLFGPPSPASALPDSAQADITDATTEPVESVKTETTPVQADDKDQNPTETAAAPKTKPKASSTNKASKAKPSALQSNDDKSPSKVRQQAQAVPEEAVSDDGSQDGSERDRGAFLLEEPVSDEFGLVLSDPASMDRAGGSGSGSGSGDHRPSFLVKDERTGSTDATPAWSELKTKAGKERKRLPLACIACRRKKIRCSGEKPACKHCLRSRTPCVYKVTARKAAPRTDYMAMLDKRLKRMEDRIIKIVPKAEQDPAVTTSVNRAVVKPGIPGSGGSGATNGTGAGSGASSAKGSSSKKRVAEEAFGPELDHWSRIGSKNRVGSAPQPHNMLLQQESEDNKLLQEGADALPPLELQEHLAEVFFENIYGQAYHLLHRPSYMRKLAYVIHWLSPSL